MDIKDFKELTIKYALEPENPDLNFDMAYEYHSRGHTASAVTHYLRCAERTENNLLAYECFLRQYYCFTTQRNRDFTCRSMLRQAINIDPKRPEAYFLLGADHSMKGEHAEAYTFYNIALEFADFDCKPLKTYVGYKNKTQILHEKARCAWEWDKNSEARDILSDIINNRYTDLDNESLEIFKDDVKRVGLIHQEFAQIKYYQKYHDRLKYKFPESEKIVINGSQVLQDMFVMYCHKGKKNGTFLEVGSADPYFANNTALLEEHYNWTGVGIEIDPEEAKKYNDSPRTATLLFQDALETNYEKLLEKYFPDKKVIDYLQLDLEPARNTFQCLLDIPFHKYKFGVITYEHDYYIDYTKSFREKSRMYLEMMGYELVVANVSQDGKNAFEDWWVHPDLIDRNIIDSIKSTEGVVNVGTYFYE